MARPDDPAWVDEASRPDDPETAREELELELMEKDRSKLGEGIGEQQG